METKERQHKKEMQEIEIDSNNRYIELKRVYQSHSNMSKSFDKQSADKKVEVDYLERIRELEKNTKSIKNEYEMYKAKTDEKIEEQSSSIDTLD
jgi:hypothetical protein